jgi:2-(3-amino-3-carboxypropyl)histidine synthase
MEYNLELEKVIEQINRSKAKTVLIQLPDGLKPEGTKIVDLLNKKTKAKIFLWLNSCYGACDIPTVKVDLVIQFGHNNLQPEY